MKNFDDQLTRLFRSAAQVAERVEAPSPFLEGRVIAHWRSGLGQVEGLLGWPMPIFRSALACAFMLMLAAFIYSQQSTSDPMPNELEVAEYEMQVSLLP